MPVADEVIATQAEIDAFNIENGLVAAPAVPVVGGL